MKAFDAPSREECTVARPRSNNALAALTLLNDPTFVEAAREFARNTLSKSDSDDARIDLAFRLATSRKPTEHERTVLANLLQQNREYYRQHAEEAQELLSIGIAQSNMTDRDSAELASWTMVARAILNLTEVITRN